MIPSGCTITSLFQLWSPLGCCNFVVALVRYGLLLLLFLLLTCSLASDTCPCFPRTCVAGAEIQSPAGILQCTCLFSVQVLPFLVPLYPRPCVPNESVDGWYPAVHMPVFSSDATFLVLHYQPPIASQTQRFSRYLVSCSARFSLPQFGCYRFWSPFFCSLHSFAPVLSAQRFSDSGPKD